MKEYKIIYAFEVLDKITEGKEVFVLDREDHLVYCVNTLSVDDFTKFLKMNDKRRMLEFWYEEEVADEN